MKSGFREGRSGEGWGDNRFRGRGGREGRKEGKREEGRRRTEGMQQERNGWMIGTTGSRIIIKESE